MSENEILVLGRIIERILIVLICGASLGFGWSLFREGILKNQEAEFSRGQWKITLKRVGPGIFFALFAVAGLIFAVTSPATVTLGSGSRLGDTSGNTATPRDTAGGGWNYDADAPVDKETRAELKAINTLTTLWQSDRSPTTPKAEVEAGDQAARVLNERKETLLRATFPNYQRYTEIKSHQEKVSTLTPEQKAQYDQFDQISKDNFLVPLAH